LPDALPISRSPAPARVRGPAVQLAPGVAGPTPGGSQRWRPGVVGLPPCREGGGVPQSDDKRLVDLAARIEQEDPRFARSLSDGRPALPREYRRKRAWWVLGIGLVLLVAGLIMPDGLLIAAGLVLSGIGVQLFDPYPPQIGRAHV